MSSSTRAATRALGIKHCGQVERGSHRIADFDVAFERQCDRFGDPESRKEAGVLERPPESPARAQVGAGVAEIVSLDQEPAAVGSREAGHEIEQGGLACAVRADEPQDLAGSKCERHVRDGLDAAEGLCELDRFEHDRPVARGRKGCLARSRALGAAWTLAIAGAVGRAVGDHSRALEKHRAQDVGPGEKFGRRTMEPDLTLFHEIGGVGHGERDVDRLLYENDRRAARRDCPNDAEQLLDDDRREAEGEFVDHQQARLGDERLAEREHLLFAARQVAGRLIPSFSQDREEAEDFLGRVAQVRLV